MVVGEILNWMAGKKGDSIKYVYTFNRQTRNMKAIFIALTFHDPKLFYNIWQRSYQIQECHDVLCDYGYP